MTERELQLLYAIQTLVTQRQHPQGNFYFFCLKYSEYQLFLSLLGLLQGIFETLYDGNVVSEEGFESWVTSEEPSEREGKTVALKSIASFMTWMREADPDSDQEADG